jgi:hypothetical protein
MPSTLTWAPDTTFPFSSVTRPLTTLLTKAKTGFPPSLQKNPRNAMPTEFEVRKNGHFQEHREEFRKAGNIDKGSEQEVLGRTRSGSLWGFAAKTVM